MTYDQRFWMIYRCEKKRGRDSMYRDAYTILEILWTRREKEKEERASKMKRNRDREDESEGAEEGEEERREARFYSET